jgi:ABC-type uncharacterized transport system involved in gliding motility auxiliary subunit
MDRSFRSGLILLAGIALLVAALSIQAILLETLWWTVAIAVAGAGLSAWGAFALRTQLGGLMRRRRAEIALFTLGLIGVLIAVGYLAVRYPVRYDLTSAGLYSLSEQTAKMLHRLAKPVHIVFFHDPLMRETVELYKLMANETDSVTIEFHDPTLNPAQARMMGVRFAGTAVLRSEDRSLKVHGATETDIANGILRVSQGAKQLVCFLDGHGEADPMSKESHDHVEATGGHSHGIGVQYVRHETHGMAKARQGLETTNYTVAKISLLKGGTVLSDCAVLVVAGPKAALLPVEVTAIDAYLVAGGNGFFMLEPFIETGLEPILAQYGVVLDDTMVLDEASHYWADVSAPAVTSYNIHMVTRELPLTFYPGVRSLSATSVRVPGTNVTPLVNSSTNSYGETTPDRAEFDEDSDLRGPNTLMVVAIRRPVTPDSGSAVELGPRGEEEERAGADAPVNLATAESRIAVVGDADFATNSFFHFLGNGNLFLNTVSYLTAQENLIGIEPRTYDLPRLSLTNRQMKGTFFLSVFLFPLLLALIGTAVWWRRQ